MSNEPNTSESPIIVEQISASPNAGSSAVTPPSPTAEGKGSVPREHGPQTDNEAPLTEDDYYNADPAHHPPKTIRFVLSGLLFATATGLAFPRIIYGVRGASWIMACLAALFTLLTTGALAYLLLFSTERLKFVSEYLPSILRYRRAVRKFSDAAIRLGKAK